MTKCECSIGKEAEIGKAYRVHGDQTHDSCGASLFPHGEGEGGDMVGTYMGADTHASGVCHRFVVHPSHPLFCPECKGRIYYFNIWCGGLIDVTGEFAKVKALQDAPAEAGEEEGKARTGIDYDEFQKKMDSPDDGTKERLQQGIDKVVKRYLKRAFDKLLPEGQEFIWP